MLVLVCVAVAVVLLPIAFVGAGVYFWVTEPAHQLDLSGSRWSIVSIGGNDTGLPVPVIAFDTPERDSATVTLECGNVVLAWAWDTDGAALNLAPVTVPEGCLAHPADAAALTALRGVEEWSVRDHDSITLIGGQELQLERTSP